MSRIDIARLTHYVAAEIEGRAVIATIESMIDQNLSTAGKRREEVFTREFVCPTLATFFYEEVRPQLHLPDDAIKRGLGAEGFANCRGFGFKPARAEKHVFTKSEVFGDHIPEVWLRGSKGKLPRFQSCPDFAVAPPLPFSALGEVKYFCSGGRARALKELYNGLREVVFYLGVFHGRYDSAILIVGDASKDHAFLETIRALRPGLLSRFGPETGIYLAPIKLH
jgi:hypothetical protein